MKYITANKDHAEEIHHVLQVAIRGVYPKYYPTEVVDFFCDLHSIEHLREGIASGNMGVLLSDSGEVVGTGCYDGTHITGVYVLPSWQGRGCGTQIVEQLEKRIGVDFDVACLDASLPAACLYEHRGYQTVGHGVIDLENDVKLVYEKMERLLR